MRNVVLQISHTIDNATVKFNTDCEKAKSKDINRDQTVIRDKKVSMDIIRNQNVQNKIIQKLLPEFMVELMTLRRASNLLKIKMKTS